MVKGGQVWGEGGNGNEARWEAVEWGWGGLKRGEGDGKAKLMGEEEVKSRGGGKSKWEGSESLKNV